MYSLLKQTQTYFTIQTNSWIFQLHSKITVGILMISFILVSTYDYIASSAIQCMGDKKIGISPGTLNTYCWFSSAYTVPRHWTGSQGKTNLDWGVGISSEEDDRVHHAYYQWVPYFIIFLALLFCLPYFLWKTSYADYISNLTNGLEMKRGKKLEIARYILSRKEEHRTFLIGLLCCEAFNLLIVGLVIFIINKFLGGNFYSYGAEVISWPTTEPEERADPISRVFPKMTKCDFYRFGPSGTVITYDALCLLGINILNEKIFLFLWFWLLLVGVLDSLFLSLRVLTTVSTLARKSISRFYFSVDSCQVVKKLSAEEWILTQQLSLVLEKQKFEDLIAELSGLLNSRNEKKKFLLEQL